MASSSRSSAFRYRRTGISSGLGSFSAKRKRREPQGPPVAAGRREEASRWQSFGAGVPESHYLHMGGQRRSWNLKGECAKMLARSESQSRPDRIEFGYFQTLTIGSSSVSAYSDGSTPRPQARSLRWETPRGESRLRAGLEARKAPSGQPPPRRRRLS